VIGVTHWTDPRAEFLAILGDTVAVRMVERLRKSARRPAKRHGTAHPTIVPYQTFAAADGDLVVAIGNDGQWRRLCEAIGDPALGSDPRWAANPDRVLRREEVVGRLAARLATRTRDEWLAAFRAARVPAGPVRTMDEVMRDPALAARGMVGPAALDGGIFVELLALPWRIEGARPPLRLPPPLLGRNTAAFLERWGA